LSRRVSPKKIPSSISVCRLWSTGSRPIRCLIRDYGPGGVSKIVNQVSRTLQCKVVSINASFVSSSEPMSRALCKLLATVGKGICAP
jgi:hypothetical protein